ncbi:adenine DNA glycosylase-like [Acanthaster planci]|uniref:Adenine DNA glycosylase n=1 Tax=Acanthaster planci TaxID=133434 RepID=A0A8B7Y678_ACAPL|nr:adenine DNA glycosylase-like [Acanthaster planci]
MIGRFRVNIAHCNLRFGVHYIRQKMKRKSTRSSAVSQRKESSNSECNSSAGEDEKTGLEDDGDFLPDGKSLRKKRKVCTDSCAEGDHTPPNPFHFFTEEKDITQFRRDLLKWYDANKRDLPWRKWADHEDPNQRAYAVWVSEIMLQQTQVATVIDYYNRWLAKWPTLEDLAISATPEEVNEMWAGLGYYSRGRRLYEGAKKVMKDLSGTMPMTAESLLKQLPGVGRYTAGAIASIAFKEPTGVVDGNVIRVFCRTRSIGADSTSQTVLSAIWSLANTLVDRERPGDFNQALMELGATVCTPKAPSCAKCPVSHLCRAFQHEENVKRVVKERLEENFIGKGPAKSCSLPDIECAADNCQLCIPASDDWDLNQGVMNFPRKPRKKPPRQEQTAVCIIQKKYKDDVSSEYLLVQRPEKGLLAGLWEFPSVRMEDHWSVSERVKAIDAFLTKDLGMNMNEKRDRRTIGEVVHVFSHIEQTYCVETFGIKESDVTLQTTGATRPCRWLSAEDFRTAAVSTAMKKCFNAYQTSIHPPKVNPKKIKFDSSGSGDSKKQSALDAFFKPVPKKKR